LLEKSEEISFTINKNQGGQRLDIYLAQSEAALSRSQVKYAIEEGDVLVNCKVPKVSQHLKEGDEEKGSSLCLAHVKVTGFPPSRE